MRTDSLQIDQALKRCQRLFPDRFTTKHDAREACWQARTLAQWHAPDAVLYAQSATDIEQVIALCAELDVPIIPHGSGTSLEGQVSAPCGGIAVSTSQMKSILDLSIPDRYCVVQPGVTHIELNNSLKNDGLFFPVDPGAAATIGGMVSTRASGTNSMFYGTMRDNTLSLEVKLSTGETIKTGSVASKSAAGYDLTRLFVGAEGTLGIITEVALRLHPIPPCIAGGMVVFSNISDAVQSVIDIRHRGVQLSKLELLDSVAIRAFNHRESVSLKEAPTIFFEAQGTSDTHVQEQLQIYSDTCKHLGAYATTALNEEELHDLWRARHDAWWAIHDHYPGRVGITTDVCVPMSQLASIIEHAKARVKALNLDAAIVGHVGDGNFHVLVMIDDSDPDLIRRTKDFCSELSVKAIQANGTCTGEHGIGVGKTEFMEMEHGLALDVMRRVKRACDPHGILNPGKIC